MLMSTLAGCYIIMKVTNTEFKILSIRNILAIAASVAIPTILYDSDYQGTYTLIFVETPFHVSEETVGRVVDLHLIVFKPLQPLKV